ncbi:PVC-type heme-binding CxxCH protein [Runella zeae]|uniref:PVC-type heme-binding CxxCH protein n=1 Tax=Runella zeae TaxID=94255 RepID=UPI000405DE85|nr:PVC-type heme-binding CxxCH protein [Runella zeae]
MNAPTKLSLLVLIGMSLSCGHYTDSLTAEEALKSFTLSDDRLTVDIFATEPQVLDPVEMVFDEEGNAFVVEMPDYPSKPEDGTLNGAIRLLRDTNRDGRIDSAVIFAEHLSEATSILPWEGGLLVAAAPDILFLKDTTGDFRADVKEVVFTGFFASNSEAQITNLHYNVDNWIYASNCGQAGEIKFLRTPKAPPISIKGGDFRFRLDKGKFEIESSSGQFGMAVDDWGNRFFTENSIHIQHAPIAGRYLYRHGFLPSYDVALNISDHDPEMFQQTPPPYWRKERTKRRNEQFAEAKLDRHEYAEDHFTGASGGTFYGADLLPKEYQGSIFTGEVAGNLVHRDILTLAPNSPTFIAKRGDKEKDKEFLVSSDPWFRPVQLSVGPDGILYMIDMYRQHIETPTAIPEDLKEEMDFFKGSQLGRIYRIIPKGAKPTPVQPRLRSKSAAELVALLAHPQQWWRLQAQRLLLEKQDKSVLASLKEILLKDTNPHARLHAFFTLEGLNALEENTVAEAFKDNQPEIRAYAVAEAERFPALFDQIVAATKDASPKVAFQACLSVGQFGTPQSTEALASILEKQVSDKWFRMGVLSSEAGASLGLLKGLQQKNFFQQITPAKNEFLEEFGHVIGARNRKGEITELFGIFEEGSDSQIWVVKGAIRGMKKLKVEPEDSLKEVLKKQVAKADSTTKANIEFLISSNTSKNP